MRIDVVSDVACPWCAIGVSALERALERIGGDLGEVEVHLQPFELNPTMAARGRRRGGVLERKVRLEPRAARRESHAHRRARRGRGLRLRHAVARLEHLRCAPPVVLRRRRGAARVAARFEAGAARGLSRRGPQHQLARRAARARGAASGLPAERAREVLERGEFAEDVRQAERFWQEVGIHSVPAVIVDRKHLIAGGQPSAVFEQALRQIAAEGTAGRR